MSFDKFLQLFHPFPSADQCPFLGYNYILFGKTAALTFPYVENVFMTFSGVSLLYFPNKNQIGGISSKDE
jgi:hypothetical protein